MQLFVYMTDNVKGVCVMVLNVFLFPVFILFIVINLYWLVKYLRNVRELEALTKESIVEKNIIHPTIVDALDYFENRITHHGLLKISSVDRTVPAQWLGFQPSHLSDKLTKKFIDQYRPDYAIIFYYSDVFIQYVLLSETQGLVTASNTRHISGVGLMRFESILRKLFNARCQCFVTTESRVDVEALIQKPANSVFTFRADTYTKLNGFHRSDLESFLASFGHDTGLFYGLSSFDFENECEI